MLIDTYGIVDDAVCWCVGLSGLFISCATKTEAFDLGRGCDSPSGLKSKKGEEKGVTNEWHLIDVTALP